jgi:drug/metabolite transporter (DMT)-like permease
MGWGAAAGLGGMAGALALYAGFRHAAFSVAGPLSAVSAAGLSVLAGVLLGERPSPVSLTGIAVALPAIILVSLSASPPGPSEPARTPRADLSPRPEPRQAGTPRSERASHPERSSRSERASRSGRRGTWAGVAYGLVAGTGFALLFVGLNRAGSRAGIWPVLSGQVVEVAVLACMLVISGAFTAGPRDAFGNAAPATAGLAAVTGLTGGAGTMLYFFATHDGFLAITAVLTSLYPAVTIGLARLFAGERLSGARLAGLALAGLSVTLIALGGAR